MINLDGLSTSLPDLDSLVDPAADFDARPISEQLGGSPFIRVHREPSRRLVTFDARKVRSAATALARLPAPREYIHVVTGSEFAGFDLLPALLRLSPAGAHYAELLLTTLGFSRDNLHQLALLIHAGQIDPARLTILCGDFFRRADSGLWDIGSLLAREHGFGFRSFRNHTKLILARIHAAPPAAEACLVVESSANLRSCQNIEFFTVTRSPSLFTFHAAWVREVFQAGKE